MIVTLVRAIILGDGVGKVHGAEVELVARAADFDQLQRDHDALKTALEAERAHSDLLDQRWMRDGEKRDAAEAKYDALLEQVRAAREAIEAGAFEIYGYVSEFSTEPAVKDHVERARKHAATLRALAALVPK